MRRDTGKMVFSVVPRYCHFDSILTLIHDLKIPNRNLAYCTLLGVLWQICHAWILYGTFRRTVLTMARLGGTSRKNQGNTPICMLLGPLWQSSHA